MSQKLNFHEKIVLALLEDYRGAANAAQIHHRVPPETLMNRNDVFDALLRLESKGLAEQVSKGKFVVQPPEQEYIGSMQFIKSGDAYFIPLPDQGLTEDIYFRSKDIEKLLPGDQVLIAVSGRSKKKKIRIKQILLRNPTRVTGILDVFEGRGYLLSDQFPIRTDIKIEGKTDSSYDGLKAVVEVFDWPERSKNPLGKLIEVLGKPGENDAEMHAIVSEFGFPLRFKEETEKEAEAIPFELSAEEIKKRKDFRDTLTFTIDPADAKDFDDAISFKELGNQRFEIGVHIADVAYYVKQGTSLDQEALLRGTSVYLADRTIPMLPERLSNDLCSLKPQVDRAAFSAVFEMDSEGNVHQRWFGRSIIHSVRRFSYEEAQERIVSKEGDLERELNICNEIAKKLTQKRTQHGAIKFESREIRFKMDSQGKPIEVVVKKRFDAHKLIEEFMLLANREVATLVKKSEKNNKLHPFIYRVHDLPPADKLIELSKFCKFFGYVLRIENPNILAHDLNKLLKDIEGKPEEYVLQNAAIRSMAKAVYTGKRTDHFGLGFPYYTHFTSPIRRYPDLLAHRLLDQFLSGVAPSHTVDQVEFIAKHSSTMEQKATDAERASTKYKMAEYLQPRIGKIFDATITGVTEWGIYAEINENHCEGMIRINDISGDQFAFLETERALMSRKFKKKLKIGDPVVIKVKNTNLVNRTIDFTLVRY